MSVLLITPNAARPQDRTMSEPVHILSLGAGVQSSTLALMAAAGLVTPMPIAAIFADTQAEPPSVYRWLDWLETQLPFPVHRVTAGNLTNDLLRLRTKSNGDTWSKSNIPYFVANQDGTRGKLHRQCTVDYKIRPITKEARRLGEIKRGQKIAGVVQWIGISLDEIQRMRQSKEPWCMHRWPLVELRMTRQKCLEWMSDRNYPTPPRSACVYCPYHSNGEWRRLRDHEPESFLEAVRVEAELQSMKQKSGKMRGVPYLHSSLKPLDQVDLRTDAEHGQASLWQDECEGMCGV